jgi:hypothetical protein
MGVLPKEGQEYAWLKLVRGDVLASAYTVTAVAASAATPVTAYCVITPSLRDVGRGKGERRGGVDCGTEHPQGLVDLGLTCQVAKIRLIAGAAAKCSNQADLHLTFTDLI